MFDARAASELIIAQIQPSKHYVPKKSYGILDIYRYSLSSASADDHGPSENGKQQENQ